MRKKYSKPDIGFENFSLSVSVANCEIHITGANAGTCAMIYDGIPIFTDDVHGCKQENGGVPIVDSATNGFCYHVPIETNNLFNS